MVFVTFARVSLQR